MSIPASDEIHLWLVNDADVDAELLSLYPALLAPGEAGRHAAFHFSSDRKRFLVTRAAIRCLLSHYVEDVAPADWQFRANAWGRPEIASPVSPLRFNISHTKDEWGSMIAIAISAHGELGVDVECLSRNSGTLEVARRYFSPAEVETLQGLPDSAQRDRFFDLWTLKEACIKACGMGLAIPLNSFSFALSADRIALSVVPQRNEHSERWQFWQARVSDRHVLALAFASQQDCQRMRVVTGRLVPMRSVSTVDMVFTRTG